MNLKRVVVTGLGAITPLGNTVEELWDSLINGVSGAAGITRFDASKFKTQIACEIKGYDPANYFDRKESRKIDPYTQYAMIAADQAIADANFNMDTLDKDRVGVIIATGIGGFTSFLQEVIEFAKGDGTPRFNPFFIPKIIGDIAAGHISIKYGFRGPNYATTSACASSGHAIIDAFNQIKLGKSSVFVVGGAEAGINPAGIGGFNAMHAISTRNDDPKTASRPFDKDRDGFVLGEGGGVIILEEYEHAIKRGAKIYVEIAGEGSTADAHHITSPHPDGLGAYMAMKLAIEEAGIKPEDVDHINTHGTSTPVGDIAEQKAVVNLFGQHAYKINLNATKSMHGHLLGSAAAVELIATILAIKNSIIPPTINHFTDDPDIDNNLNFTFGNAVKREVNFALSNSFGFGGHNTCIALKKFQDK
ncbi:MAG: beta-ketoacyl-ACP synthase II [Bacteroidales bacterium]|jgi:3-oxoacyl-[acyl-carrier-protein] synthase II|nr:beta-ketoacyl-ACP synthase II [Bacteroidales bacterium]MDI9591742.1 beta-ketoacyl-ACP synthase II [Bacteroidota bacterium]OQC36958.1 MAG: 3-oxoacyl-(acyl-carrier-protein) synthase 2 [Bacteroidetes bacterium ADurb.Bin041]HNV50269.1 beta-ketoacyl-ACP synthase II [Bacteroidales bacterium]HOF80143.1 beta-ketoacyl-ACP synthase II [Bacteroidales bacterium]